MDPPEPETLWKMIAGAASAIVTTCLGVLGIQYRQYRTDRATLTGLKTKMDEVDKIREKTDDGRIPLAMLERLSDRMGAMATALETVVERQDTSDLKIEEMAVSIGKTETNVEWIKRHLEAGPQRR